MNKREELLAALTDKVTNAWRKKFISIFADAITNVFINRNDRHRIEAKETSDERRVDLIFDTEWFSSLFEIREEKEYPEAGQERATHSVKLCNKKNCSFFMILILFRLPGIAASSVPEVIRAAAHTEEMFQQMVFGYASKYLPDRLTKRRSVMSCSQVKMWYKTSVMSNFFYCPKKLKRLLL